MKQNVNGKERCGEGKMANGRDVLSEVRYGKRVRPAGVAQRLLALVLVAAMVVTSGGWSVLAEENATELVENVTEDTEQEEVADVSVNAPASGSSSYELPSYELREFADGTISYTNSNTVTQQFVCEELGGIYLLGGKSLSFYSLETQEISLVYTFTGNTSAYVQGDYLYVLYSKTVYAYDLVNQELTKSMSIDSDYTAQAVGADASGRIYVAASHSTDDGTVYEILLYSADWELLSTCETGMRIYTFDGFDSSTGYYYVEGYYNWVYWGYDHPGRAAMYGTVSDNVITFSSTIISYLCQSSYYLHQNGAALLGDRYLAVSSTTYGYLYILDSDNSLARTMTLSRSAIDYKLSSTYYDTISIGVRTVYNDEHDSLIIYTGDKTLVEYDMETGEELATFTTAHYIFNILQMGETLLIIEKEDGVYYLEIVDWSESDGITISGTSSSLQVGDAMQLTADAGRPYSVDCTWSSSDNSIASVTSTGRVVAWNEGTATITASILDGKYSATYTVTVTASDVENPDENITVLDGTVSDNVSDNNYTVYGTTVKSYITENEDGTLTRVEYVSGTGVLVETYSADYTLVSTTTLEAELSIFGGFYEGDNYNFLVFGQSNTAESDECEVVRVVKYDKDWNRISQCSIYGANTYYPFSSGSLRMVETEGMLYIYTCHTMYVSSDGYHHQANMTYVISEETMEVSQSYYSVMNIAQAGYVSHSFNQYIQTDGTYVYRVDHGDANPRAVSITRCSVDGEITSVSYTYALTILGSSGANATGVSVGGFELSTDNCLIIGNSVDQSDSSTYSASGQRNIFLSVVDKDFNSKNIIWLTDYTSEDGITPRTPQLVKITEDHFLVLWEEYNSNTKETTVKALTVDGDGTVSSDIITIDARLSDCQPIVTTDGIVKWYVTDGSAVKLYSLNPFDLYSAARLNLEVENTDDGIKVSWEDIPGTASYKVYRRKSDGELELVQTTTDTSWMDTDVTAGVEYIYQIYATSSRGSQTESEEVSITFVQAPVLTTVSNVSGGVQVTWNLAASATYYYIYYKQSAATSYSYLCVEAEDGDTQSYTISATSGNTYDFYVKSYVNGSFSQASNGMSQYYLKAPVICLTTVENGLEVYWTSVSGADSYQIYRKTEDGEYSLIQTVTDTSWVDETVESGVSYTYQVYACADGVCSYPSTEKTKMYLATPEIIEIKNGTTGVGLVLKTVEGAEKYYIYYKLSTDTSYRSAYATAGSDDTQSVLIYLFSSGSVYDFYIKAYGSSGYSLPSDTVSQMFIQTPSLTLTTDEGGNQLSWAAITGAEGYTVYRKTGEDEYVLVQTTADTAWTDSDIEDGVTYTYQVYAYADGVYSGASTERSGGRVLVSDCTITLSSSSYTYNGSAKEPTVTVKNGTTKLTNGTHYTVEYSDNVNAGTATVTITGMGAYAGTATKTFTINKASQTLTATIASSYISYGGSTTIITSGTGDITYSSSDTSVATVSSDGTVTGVGVGTAKITVTASGDDNYSEASKSISVSVSSVSISGAEASLDTTSYTYDGTEKKPGVTLTYGDETLVENQDYTVSYSNNINAGTGRVVITGTGNFRQTVTLTFTISKASQTVTASASSSLITVGNTATITANGAGTITYSSSDKTVAKVSSSGVVTGVSAGTATITVNASGNSNYNAGTATVSITVEAQQEPDGEEPDTEEPDTEEPDTGEPDEGESESEEPESQESESEEPESQKQESEGSETQETESEESGTGSSDSESSGADTSTTNKISACTITLSKTSYTYDGTAKKPSVTVKYGSKTLTKDTDYTVTYSNNTNAGTATVKITGKGNYTGSVSKTFTVNSKSISSCQMVFSKVGELTASTVDSYLIMMDGDTILDEYEDYIIWSVVYYYDSTGAVSDLILYVEGDGNYTGEMEFTLNPITAKTVLKSATKTSSGVKLTWQKETGAVGYQIYRKTDSGSYSLVKTITKNSTTSWTDTTVADYKQYTYYVRAYTVSTSGKVYATKSSTKTVSTYLTTPTIKSASNTSSGVKLTWSAVSGAAKYQIWRKTSSGSWTKLGTTTSTSYTDKTAKSGTTYSYRLRCVKSNGTTATSLYSSAKSIRRLSAGKVSSLTNTSSGITVKWSKVTGASGYYIYRKAGSGSYKNIATVSGSSTVSYTNKTTGTYKVANGTTYTYYVIPYYKSGSTVTKGTYSTTKKTVRMTAVSLSSVKNSSSKKMTVKWAKNTKATGYQIQYSTSSSFTSGSKTKTVTVSGASTVSKTIGSLTKSKKYYVRIRTYKTVSGTKYYSAWSSKKSVTISK